MDLLIPPSRTPCCKDSSGAYSGVKSPGIFYDSHSKVPPIYPCPSLGNRKLAHLVIGGSSQLLQEPVLVLVPPLPTPHFPSPQSGATASYVQGAAQSCPDSRSGLALGDPGFHTWSARPAVDRAVQDGVPERWQAPFSTKDWCSQSGDQKAGSAPR